MRVLVTGAAGFLGSHLVDRLLADRHEVTGVDDLSTGRIADLAAARRRRGLSFTRFDVTGEGLADLVAHDRPEAVCALTAAPLDAAPAVHARTTVVGTVQLLEACVRAGVRKVVLACDPQVYGAPRPVAVTERARLAPTTAYGAAQVGALVALDAYRARLGTTALVLASVYGPRARSGPVAELARALLTGEPVLLPPDAGCDLVHVDDAVDALVRALGARADGRRLHVGSGTLTAVSEVQRLLAAPAGVPRAAVVGPRPRLGDPLQTPLEIGGIRRALGWEPTTPLVDGLRETSAWARQEWG